MNQNGNSCHRVSIGELVIIPVGGVIPEYWSFITGMSIPLSRLECLPIQDSQG